MAESANPMFQPSGNKPVTTNKPATTPAPAPAMGHIKNSGGSSLNLVGKMMGGNTVISTGSLKGRALLGRTDNLASKKMFRVGRHAGV